MDYKEAAKRLGISVPAVYKALKEGRLEGTKSQSGKWEISEEAILKFQGKQEAEADLFKAEWVIKKQIDSKEAKIFKKISGFCARYSELYEANDTEAARQWAEKIAEQVNELNQIKAAFKLIGEAIMDNITPLEEPYQKGEDIE